MGASSSHSRARGVGAHRTGGKARRAHAPVDHQLGARPWPARPACPPARAARALRPPTPDSSAREPEAAPRAARTPGAWTWPALMRRVFALDVLACPRGGGRLRVLATVHDPLTVQAILAHLARS